MDFSISAAKSLFLGKIVDQNFFPFPTVKAEEKETIEMVIDSVNKFLTGKEAQFRQYDKEGMQPAEYLDSLRELGLFGLIIPEEYGGIGLSNTGYSRVLQQVTRYDGSTSLTIGAHSSIGMKGLLLFGTPEQKQKYLPRLASGETIAAFCLTEPESGSDAAPIKTHAERQSDGSWILNGEKLWITNGPLADFFTVFARTGEDKGKVTGFIVERGEGVTHGHKEDKLGIRASATSTVNFNNVKLAPSQVLGEEGKGFKVAMAILNNGRTGLGGGCVGAMKRVINHAIRQAKDRKQFGKSIAEFQLIQDKIAQMTVSCFAAESAVSMVCHYIDSGHQDYSVEAAMSKVFATEALWVVGSEALQIAGGNGFMKEYPYEMVVRDSRINMIFEGTNEILRLFIALSAFDDVGRYLKDVEAGFHGVLKDPIKGFGVLSDYAGKKVAGITSIGRDKLSKIHPLLKGEGEIIEKYVSHLGEAADQTVKKLRKKIVGEQLISRRFADTAIDLFVSLSVLARVTKIIEEKGADQAIHGREIAKIFINQAKRRMNGNLRRLAINEDAEVKSLAKFLIDSEEYGWDTLS